MAALLSAALASCSEGPSQPGSPSASKAAPDTVAVREAARNFRVHYNMPVDLDSTGFYYQPVSVLPLDYESRNSYTSSSSYGGDSNYEDPNAIIGTCYNLLFFQKATLAEHALLPHGRFVITNINAATKPDVRWPFLFYTIVKADTNHDGEQNGEDAGALFVSDRSGHQLRQLTPDGAQLENWHILPKTSLLLAQIRPDTNHDLKFTHADGTYWLRFDLRNPTAAPVRQPATALGARLQQQMLDRQSRLAE